MKKSFTEKKEFVVDEKKLDDLHYKIFVGFAILKLVYYFIFQKPIIGGDFNYSLFNLWIPLFIGFFGLTIYRWKYIKVILFVANNWFWNLIRGLFLIVQGVLCSYVIVVGPSEIIWEGLNRIEIKEASVETKIIDIKQFRFDKGSGSKYKILFDFKGESERIKVSYKLIKEYKDVDAKDYKLSLDLKKGLNDTYVIEDWKVIKK